MTDYKLFTGTASIASIPMATTHYAELGRKGLNSDNNHMRVVERRFDKVAPHAGCVAQIQGTQAPTRTAKLLPLVC
jgi:hypothetical protein